MEERKRMKLIEVCQKAWSGVRSKWGSVPPGASGRHPRLPDTGDAGKLLPGVGGKVGEGC